MDENYELKDDQFGLKISLARAEEINIGLKATKLLKKNRIKFIRLNNAEANYFKKIFLINLNNIKKSDDFLFDKLKFLDSDLVFLFKKINSA